MLSGRIAWHEQDGRFAVPVEVGHTAVAQVTEYDVFRRREEIESYKHVAAVGHALQCIPFFDGFGCFSENSARGGQPFGVEAFSVAVVKLREYFP